ncbi:unnamed protein product [Peronospora belbahrii]|uniref:PHD-type domain-containing protein n=1 Tax=Peronospora belbahrii TaxID=622444 RepID=A0ABN8D845_9STRA|nr:unnamed protein product [Peronospora belbahrii]
MANPQSDIPACSVDITRNNMFVSSPCVFPGERNQYPVNIAVDFTRLRSHALRKYMTFYNIPQVPESSREELAITVARHFHVECKKTDENSSITSFVTFLTGSNDTVKAAEMLRSRSQMYQVINKKQDDDNQEEVNQVNDHINEVFHTELVERHVDDLYGQNTQEDGAEFDGMMHSFVVKKRRMVNQQNAKDGPRGHDQTHEHDDAGGMQKKKRKGRLYCICKGGSFGNMIACDNKKCLDRSNWYHMSCVSLNPIDEPPKTWYCPACQANDSADIPENQYRKPVASVTYGDMISHALTILPEGKGSFKDICDFVETEYESQLNWKLESDQRKSPVWKSSVRKILFSNGRFRKHPEGKGLFCLAV